MTDPMPGPSPACNREQQRRWRTGEVAGVGAVRLLAVAGLAAAAGEAGR